MHEIWSHLETKCMCQVNKGKITDNQIRDHWRDSKNSCSSYIQKGLYFSFLTILSCLLSLTSFYEGIHFLQVSSPPFLKMSLLWFGSIFLPTDCKHWTPIHHMMKHCIMPPPTYQVTGTKQKATKKPWPVLDKGTTKLITSSLYVRLKKKT